MTCVPKHCFPAHSSPGLVRKLGCESSDSSLAFLGGASNENSLRPTAREPPARWGGLALFFFLAQPQMLNSRSAVEGAVFSLAQALAALIHCYGIGDGDGALETAPPPKYSLK